MNSYLIISLIFIVVFLLVNFIFSFNQFSGLKLFAFESGFDFVGYNQLSLGVHFVFIMLIFVIFDLELILFLSFLLMDVVFFYLFFLYFLLSILTFYMEWYLEKMLWVFSSSFLLELQGLSGPFFFQFFVLMLKFGISLMHFWVFFCSKFFDGLSYSLIFCFL